MKYKYKFQMYEQLEANKLKIYAEARKAADEIGIPKDMKGKVGLGKGASWQAAPLRREVLEAIVAADKEIIANQVLMDELRTVVKDVYGDDYDAAATSTGEAALWLAFDVLVSPPTQGRGDNYRASYIAPYERHMHHQAGYGRPKPAKYKDLYADRGVTAGELGLYGKRLHNLDTIIVPLEGAEYNVHGIKYHPCPLLTRVDPEASIKEIAKVAERNVNTLMGFTSLGYDTPGYGYGAKDEDGVPKLQKFIGELAAEHNVVYINDNAGGLPFIGTDPCKVNADIMIYSGDKSIPGLTSGLIIGKEDAMIQIRRALGMHGNRWGTTRSYGKAAYVTFDPGKHAIVGLIAALKILRDEPEKIKRQVDRLYDIVIDEFGALDSRLREGIIITKTYNRKCVEVNYEQTWKDGELGIPIFSIEDLYAGTCLISTTVKQMGIGTGIVYDANIMLQMGMGNTDEYAQLIEERERYGLKALIKSIEIICKYAGILD